ncbi:MAG TPA: fluoride efflux transporter CrcB [Dehalococcoidia bacterium]|nr:fluoride efflux transporter CrcB [Dehalococcoidia bacterium]
MNVIYLAIGGALGTLSRYYVTGWVAGWNGTSGLGVFTVNIIGSFIIGLFLTLATERFMWPPELRLAVAVGFIGGFTTFSSLAWETLQMLQVRNVVGATLNITASVVLGMLAVYAGSVLGKSV